VIIANHLWLQTIVGRSVPSEKCSVYLNHIDPEIFYRRQRTRQDDRFIVIFPGTWQWHQGLDVAIGAMAYLKADLPRAELHLYGGGGGPGMENQLRALAAQLGVADRVKFCGDVSLSHVADVMANADVGVVPKRADSFGNEAYSTKIMEFMSQGLPVVASRTKIDPDDYDASGVEFIPSGDCRALASAIVNVSRNKQRRDELVSNGLKYVAANSWNRRKAAYLNLVDTLTTESFREIRSAPSVAVRPRNGVVAGTEIDR
jgi:glycosyltransferase involved in cell wall biosynthesis